MSSITYLPGSTTSYIGGSQSSYRPYSNCASCMSLIVTGQYHSCPKPKEESTMLSVYKDIKDFIREHKGIIFTIVFIAIVDKVLFEGALRERLKGVLTGLLGKAEKLATKE